MTFLHVPPAKCEQVDLEYDGVLLLQPKRFKPTGPQSEMLGVSLLNPPTPPTSPTSPPLRPQRSVPWSESRPPSATGLKPGVRRAGAARVGARRCVR